MPELNIKLVIDGKEANATLNLTDAQIQQITRSSKQAGETATDSFSKIGMAVTGINQGIDLAKRAFEQLAKPLQDAGQFEQYETSLKVMLGSTEAAQKRLEELVQFAKDTPFELPEVVNAANQLQAIGKYSQDTLRNLGDLSSASGKPMEQAMSAYAKMMTGQKGIAIDMFRDLLISADDWSRATGKKIGKNGELQASVEEMAAALPKIIKEKGFEGMMKEQSKTLLGMNSNLADSLQQLSTDVGKMLMPIAKDIVDALIPAIGAARTNLELIINTVEIGTVAFISYQVAVNGATVATSLYETAVLKAMYAMDALKAAWATNPFGLAVTALATVTAALYLYADAQEDAALDAAKAYKEQIANDEAALKTKQENINKNIQLLKTENDLVEKYRTLYAETQRLTAGSKARIDKERELHEIMMKLAQKYPDIISLNQDFATALDAINTVRNQNITKEAEYQKALTETIKLQKEVTNNKFWTDYNVKIEEVLKNNKNVNVAVNGTDINLSQYLKDKAYSGSTSDRIAGVQDVIRQIAESTREGKTTGSIKDSTELDKLKAGAEEILLMLNQKMLTDLGGGQDDSNKKKTSGSTDDGMLKAQQKIQKENQAKKDLAEAHAMDIIGIEEKLMSERERIEKLNSQISSTADKDAREKLEFQKDLSEQKINIYEKELKEKQDLMGKEWDEELKMRMQQAEEGAKLAEKKREWAEEDVLRTQLEVEQNRVKKMSYADLVDSEIQERRKLQNLKKQMSEAQTPAEHEELKKQADNTQQKIDLYKSEKEAKEEQTKNNILAGAAEYDASKTFAENMAQLSRKRIMMAISEAVAEQLKSVLASVPFPFSLVVAPLAGMAIQGLLEGLIPKFEKGGLAPAGQLVMMNEKGSEYIINAQATREYLPYLQAMNSGIDPFNSILNTRMALSASGGSNANAHLLEDIRNLLREAPRYKLQVGDRDASDINLRADRRLYKET